MSHDRRASHVHVVTDGHTVTELRVSRKRNEHGEWVVRVRVNGVRTPEADYFTTDRDDAVDTARAMAVRLDRRCANCGQPLLDGERETCCAHKA